MLDIDNNKLKLLNLMKDYQFISRKCKKVSYKYIPNPRAMKIIMAQSFIDRLLNVSIENYNTESLPLTPHQSPFPIISVINPVSHKYQKLQDEDFLLNETVTIKDQDDLASCHNSDIDVEENYLKQFILSLSS